MKTPIVVTEKEYAKGKKVFDPTADRFDWIVCDPSEEKAAQAVRASGARVAVLGVDRYAGPLYEALESNGGGRPTLIARHGVGYDGVSVDLCKKHGVILTITKNAPDRSVAEHTIALILAFAKNIVFCDGEMRAGRFGPKRGFDITGKTLGIAGLGNIGKQTALIAAGGFGMRVIAYGAAPEAGIGEKEGLEPAAYKAKYGIAEYFDDFGAFASEVDVLSVHMPVRAETIRFFNPERFSRIRKGALFVNTSRGKLVDEDALYDALASGRLSGAALDVYDREPYIPASPDKDLRRLPNTVLTPHTASDTEESNRNMQTNIVANIDAYLAGDFGSLSAVFRP
jgi:lactate dehydrogenase-like 2-hydroxyacid dehydrogenase